jgi:hypothetical protein
MSPANHRTESRHGGPIHLCSATLWPLPHRLDGVFKWADGSDDHKVDAKHARFHIGKQLDISGCKDALQCTFLLTGRSHHHIRRSECRRYSQWTRKSSKRLAQESCAAAHFDDGRERCFEVVLDAKKVIADRVLLETCNDRAIRRFQALRSLTPRA